MAEHHFESQRQKLVMAYIDARPPDGVRANGQTVVLLHGKNFNAAYWAPTIKALTAAGFRVVAPDQIGFGKSSKPEGYQFSFAQLTINTRTLLQGLGIDKVALVGHSMGGMLATRFAVTFPDLVERGDRRTRRAQGPGEGRPPKELLALIRRVLKMASAAA